MNHPHIYLRLCFSASALERTVRGDAFRVWEFLGGFSG